MNSYIEKQKGFTLVELIVVITILAILGTIGYISLLSYNVIARDTVRVSDITNIAKVVELYRLQEGLYPPVSNPSNVTFSGSTLWTQGTFGKESRIAAKRISEIPKDPLTGNEYAYSKTQSTLEYQVGSIVERSNSYLPNVRDINPFYKNSYAVEVNNILPNFLTTTIRGNYNGKYITYTENISPVLKNIYVLGVPSILTTDITDTNLEQIHANKRFVHEGGNNAPGSYSGSVKQKGWSFTPVNTTGNVAIIYQGTNQDLSTDQGKIDFITNLQSYYANTQEVIGSSDFSQLRQINPAVQTEETLNLVNTYLGTGHGGLSGEGIGVALSQVNTGNSCVLSSSDLGSLNSWVNVVISGEGGNGPSSNVVGNASPGYGSLSAEQWCSITNFSLENGFAPVLTSIPEAFYNLNNLETIAFNDQNISQLSKNIVNFTNLSSFTFEGNTALGNLAINSWGNNGEVCQDNITPTGERICFDDSKTPIGIKVASAPTITLAGAITINLHVGDTFIDPGFNANDREDGDISSVVNVSGTVNMNVAGTYTLTYTVLDSDNNATTVTRDIIVAPAYTYSWNSSSWGSCSANPYWGSYGSYGGCSRSCGGGTQYAYRSCYNTSGTESRSVTCRRSDGIVVSDSFCSGTKPSTSRSCSESCSGSSSTSRSCNTHSCYSYSWATSSWGSCVSTSTSGSWTSCSCSSSTSGTQSRWPTHYGYQTRSVYCRRSDGTSVSDSYCSGGKPNYSQSCSFKGFTEWRNCSCSCPGTLMNSCSEYTCAATGTYGCGDVVGPCPTTWRSTGASCPSYCRSVLTSPTTYHCQ